MIPAHSKLAFCYVCIMPLIFFAFLLSLWCYYYKYQSHQHNLIYKIECPTTDCPTSYIGETGRRISLRIKEHSNGNNKASRIVQRTLDKGHVPIRLRQCSILSNNIKNSIRKRKYLRHYTYVAESQHWMCRDHLSLLCCLTKPSSRFELSWTVANRFVTLAI
jgi:hypothetical protein